MPNTHIYYKHILHIHTYTTYTYTTCTRFSTWLLYIQISKCTVTYLESSSCSGQTHTHVENLQNNSNSPGPHSQLHNSSPKFQTVVFRQAIESADVCVRVGQQCKHLL